MLWRIGIGLSVFVGTALALRALRAYPWELALLSGASLGALTFVTLQTAVRLRETLRQFHRTRPPE